jgi:hypothetical protein
MFWAEMASGRANAGITSPAAWLLFIAFSYFFFLGVRGGLKK